MMRGLFLAAGAAALGAAPATKDKVAYARWMASALDWGTLTTTSARSDGSTLGDAFGNPYSFADVAGVPYIYATDMDASMIDTFGPNSTTARATLSLSEASIMPVVSSCKIATGAGRILDPLGDPENPPCARLVLSGKLSKIKVGSDEEKAGETALFAKHPSFKLYPPGHSFYVAKLEVDGVWLINFYGGAATPAAKDYLDFKAPSTETPLIA